MRRNQLGGALMNNRMREGQKKVAKQIEEENLKRLSEQLETFTKNLETFAKEHKDDIQFSSSFRKDFYSMCIEIGVDPLASISLWSKQLNLAEFYYTLAIQIITISMTKGPLIEINQLRNMLKKHMKAEENKKDITIEDIEQAIKSVSELKCGFQIVEINNSKAVVTVPMEKPASVDKIIKLASENNGWIGYSICFNKANMEKIEFENAIQKLISHGIAWSDEQNFIKSETKNDDVIYWFPGIIGKS